MAGNRIKGITIEIEGNSTKLQSALKGVNSNLRETQSALKDVDKLLKLNPGNVELLQQKQKLLADAVQLTSEKLKTEKDALDQLKNGPQTEETIRQQEALTREIIDTENQLDSLTKQYEEFGAQAEQQTALAAEKMKAAGEEIRKTGEKMSSIGSALTKGVTVPIVGVATASVAAWNEVDSAMDTIVTKTGATGEALQDMQDRAQRIAQTIPTSFQTAADAVGEVNTRFGLTGDALEDLSTKFVQFSELNGTDVSGSIDLVQASLAAFDLGADQAGNMLDILNKAGQDTGISVDKLAGLLTTNAAVLKEMGYSASDSAFLLANLSKNGVDSSAAMTGLKKAYAESVKEGIPMNEMLMDLQTRLQNSDTYADTATEALDLFGSKAGGALVDALANGRMSFEELGTSMSEFSGNVASTFEETLDPMDSMTTTMNTLKSIGADLVNTAGPMLTDMFQGIADVVHTVADAWNSLDEDQQQMIIKCAGIAAAAGPIIAIAGKGIEVAGSLVSAGSGLISSFANISGKLGGLAQGAGSAVDSMSNLGGAAASAAGPMGSAGGSLGALSANAKGLIAAGAGILMVSAGIALLAQSAIAVSEAGAPAAVAMGVMVGAVALMAAGAAALAPALTAGAVGFVAFGAGITLVGAGILATTGGIALLAAQLPTISEHGAGAAEAIGKLAVGMVAFGAGAVAGGAGSVALAAGLLSAAAGLTAAGAGAVVATAGMVPLSVALAAVSAEMLVIESASSSAAEDLQNMVSAVDVVESGLSSMENIAKEVIGSIVSVFEGAQPSIGSAADGVAQSMNESMARGMVVIAGTVQNGMTVMRAEMNFGMQSTLADLRKTLRQMEEEFRNVNFTFSRNIALPHFKINGGFNVETGAAPSVSVSWYRKAYDNAYILSNPTIFGQMNGKYLGGGEGSGSEMIVGTEKLMSMIREAGGQRMDGDIIIPVYIGNEMIDEKVVNVLNRNNYRSGGR